MDRRAELTAEYAALLRGFLEAAPESAACRAGEEILQSAYDLARRAMDQGLGVVDLATMHHQALEGALAGRSPAQIAATVRAAAILFIESLSPFEMTHRAFSESNAALRSMNERLEQEAGRIAHALHAEAGQLIAYGQIAINRLEADMGPEGRARTAEIRGAFDRIHDQLRQISHELRPTILDELGLLPALRFLAEGTSERSGIEVAVKGTLPARLDAPVETAIYRVAQEGLNNYCEARCGAAGYDCGLPTTAQPRMSHHGRREGVRAGTHCRRRQDRTRVARNPRAARCRRGNAQDRDRTRAGDDTRNHRCIGGMNHETDDSARGRSQHRAPGNSGHPREGEPGGGRGSDRRTGRGGAGRERKSPTWPSSTSRCRC